MEKKISEEAVNVVDNPTSMHFESITSYGVINISDRVLMTIVKKAACAVKGVSKLGGNACFIDVLSELIYRKKFYDKSISVNITGNSVEIEVKINVEFNENIPNVALNVQKTVAEEVKNITGMDVKKVNVIINEVEDKKDIEQENNSNKSQ